MNEKIMKIIRKKGGSPGLAEPVSFFDVQKDGFRMYVGQRQHRAMICHKNTHFLQTMEVERKP